MKNERTAMEMEMPVGPASQSKELGDWREIKLASLHRALEFTQRTEFVDADQHAIQTRLEMLKACWIEYGNVCRQWLSINNESNHACMEQGEEVCVTAKTAFRSRMAVLLSLS